MCSEGVGADSRQTSQEETAGRTRGLFGQLTLVPNITAERQLPRSWRAATRRLLEGENKPAAVKDGGHKHKSIAARPPLALGGAGDSNVHPCLPNPGNDLIPGRPPRPQMAPHLRKVM